MSRPLRTAPDVADHRICTECDACTDHRPEQIEMRNVQELRLVTRQQGLDSRQYPENA